MHADLMTKPREEQTELLLRIQSLFADYLHCIDDDRLEEWPAFFVDDGRYLITTRENHELGYPVGLIYCDGRDMMVDRVTAMRTANIYEPHYYRHTICATRFLESDPPEYKVESSFTVTRVMHSGEITPFNCGKYVDRIVEVGGVLKFKERTVVLDSRQVDTLLVIPL